LVNPRNAFGHVTGNTASPAPDHVGPRTGVIRWLSDETVQFLSCSPPAAPGAAIAVSGHFKIVAANGDEIDSEYETTGTFDTVNGISVQGGYTFVSGTGRFSNVTGNGVIVAHGIASPPFDFVGALDGTIKYSGK
jgi:hypothetical protein